MISGRSRDGVGAPVQVSKRPVEFKSSTLTGHHAKTLVGIKLLALRWDASAVRILHKIFES